MCYMNGLLKMIKMTIEAKICKYLKGKARGFIGFLYITVFFVIIIKSFFYI